MTSSEERGRLRRIDRLARLLPGRRIPGDRRVDQELRQRVDAVPDGTDPDILERRRELARRPVPVTTITDIAAKMLEGQTVLVYQKPITREDEEGSACIRKVHHYDPCSPDYGLADCDVEFIDEPGRTFRRSVRFDAN